jgi:aminoglycoside phosphotransferase (APT) family kinase protein
VRIDPGQIATAFGLGVPRGPLLALGGGSSARTHGLATTHGRWVVKIERPLGAWQREAKTRSYLLERAALDAGVAMPRPVEPPPPAVGFWHDAGDRLIRVVEHVAGATPVLPADPALAGWVGSTLAAIAGLELAADLDADESYPLHPVAGWRAWVAEAGAGRPLVAHSAAALLPAVAEATAVVEAALVAAPAARLAHRDFRPANVLADPGGHTLIDWDYGGPEVPWWEAVHTAFRFAGALGLDGRADGPTVRRVLAAYLDAGGPAGPADRTAFAALLRSMLAGTAYSLWLALGHRPAEPARRAQAARDVRATSMVLPRVLASLDRWATLLP